MYGWLFDDQQHTHATTDVRNTDDTMVGSTYLNNGRIPCRTVVDFSFPEIVPSYDKVRKSFITHTYTELTDEECDLCFGVLIEQVK